jgi:hypothetical protein
LWYKSVVPFSQGGLGFCFNPTNPLSATYCDFLEDNDAGFKSAIDLAENAEKGLCAIANAAGCPLNCLDPKDIVNLGTVADDLRAEVDLLKEVFVLNTIPSDQVTSADSRIAVFQTQALALPNTLTFPPQPMPQPVTGLPPDDTATMQLCAVNSFDPNAKIGTSGIGPLQFIQGGLPAPYVITFENAPTATAPAARVAITDQLDSNFDLSTLYPQSIQIGSKALQLSGSGANFTGLLDLRPDQNMLVKVEETLSSANISRYVGWFAGSRANASACS